MVVDGEVAAGDRVVGFEVVLVVDDLAAEEQVEDGNIKNNKSILFLRGKRQIEKEII